MPESNKELTLSTKDLALMFQVINIVVGNMVNYLTKKRGQGFNGDIAFRVYLVPETQEKVAVPNIFELPLEDFFTPERITAAGFPVAHNLARMAHLWEFKKYLNLSESEQPAWMKWAPKLYTVGDLLKFGVGNLSNSGNTYKMGLKTVAMVKKILLHHGIDPE